MYLLFIILLFASPFLLLATYLMTAKSKSFWKIFVAHSIVFMVYMAFVINYSKLLTGHDEYGLGQLGLALAFIIGHIIIGFVLGLYMTIKNRQS
jgi:hypothetical protein